MVQRVNFASDIIGDLDREGIVELVESIRADAGGGASPESLVQASLKHLGNIQVSDQVNEGLVEFASNFENTARPSNENIASLLQLIVATREFQFV